MVPRLRLAVLVGTLHRQVLSAMRWRVSMSCVLCDDCSRLIDTDYDVEAYWGYEPDRPNVRSETVTRTTIDRWLCSTCREPYEEMEEARICTP